jgi:hypothetical protein
MECTGGDKEHDDNYQTSDDQSMMSFDGRGHGWHGWTSMKQERKFE